MKKGLIIISMFFSLGSFSQNLEKQEAHFEKAYELNPTVPRGMLEAMVWYHSRGENLRPAESCTGQPTGFGLFNLLKSGKGFFKPTAILVERHSTIPIYIMEVNEEQQILAMAKAYSAIYNSVSPQKSFIQRQAEVIQSLSQIPSGSSTLAFARQSELFEILKFYMAFSGHELNMESLFGSNLKFLESKHVDVESIEQSFKWLGGGEIEPCYDFASDIFTQTPSCNFNSRPEAVSAVTVHTIQGSYAGAIAWAQNCNANVSYHYVVRSSDGQITQMLCESDRGWHVGSENDYTIGIEHEGYVTEPAWYTQEMYFASSNLVHDISQSGYAIDPHRTAHFPWSASTHYNVAGIPGNCNRIKGHQHYPNQTHTDPGPNWDWDHYYKLIDPLAVETTISAQMGDFTDDGGINTPYSNDLRSLTLFEPTGATQVELTFTHFDLELDWDYLYIYDGWSVFDTLIGVYTGTDSPGTITSSTGSLLVEFRSDCSVSNEGWQAHFTGQVPVGSTTLKSSQPKVYPNPTNGVLVIEGAKDLTWTLFDIRGQSIISGFGPESIDISSLNLEGQTLILRMASASETAVQRIVYQP